MMSLGVFVKKKSLETKLSNWKSWEDVYIKKLKKFQKLSSLANGCNCQGNKPLWGQLIFRLPLDVKVEYFPGNSVKCGFYRLFVLEFVSDLSFEQIILPVY